MQGELMSRIGKRPIEIPQGVKVEQSGRKIKVSGKLGTLELLCLPGIRLKIDESAGKLVVENENPDSRRHKRCYGTMRSLLANMVEGVNKGFQKKMEIYGTGYGVKEQNGKLILQVGFCHPVERKLPNDVKVNIETGATRGNEVPARFTLTGPDKQVVGEFAADLRSIKPPEPYKGKGIRYADEHVKHKVGKAFTSGPA